MPRHVLDEANLHAAIRDKVAASHAYPMVFVRGVLVGGAGDLTKLIASGELERMLAAKAS